MWQHGHINFHACFVPAMLQFDTPCLFACLLCPSMVEHALFAYLLCPVPPCGGTGIAVSACDVHVVSQHRHLLTRGAYLFMYLPCFIAATWWRGHGFLCLLCPGVPGRCMDALVSRAAVSQHCHLVARECRVACPLSPRAITW